MINYIYYYIRSWGVAIGAMSAPLWNVPISQINDWLTAGLTTLGILIAVLKLVALFRGRHEDE